MEKAFLLRLENHELFNKAKALSKIRRQSVNSLINSILDVEIKKNKKNIDKYVSISK